jgi:predicted transposase/invertase (TIGR01784 family)
VRTDSRLSWLSSIERMGIEQGIEQGKDRATQTIALNLLRKNISLETIAEVTGLTIAQLQQLKASQENS